MVKTIEPVRVTDAQIKAAIAAYPSSPTGTANIFGGRAGASKASVWDYCLVCTPGAFWLAPDIARVYAGLHARGLRPQAGGVYAASGTTQDLGHTSYNGLHTSEHTTTKALRKCWVDKAGQMQPHVLRHAGGWILNPAWMASILAAGGRIEAGYPALPIGGVAKKAAVKPAKTVKPAAAPAAAPAVE